jgi:aldose 1-epimerase
MIRLFCLLTVTFPFVAAAQNYTAKKMSDHGVDIIRLTDAVHGVEVSIAPSIGNLAYAMRIHGRNILYSTLSDSEQLNQTSSANGIPFLAPWANRMADGGFWANGKKYTFNAGLGSVRLQPTGISLHGMLLTSPLWEVTALSADANSARVTSRLQFWRYPDLMGNWPFAHEYEMTYRLADGMLEVQTVVTNLGALPMPLALGYHPCYNLPGVSRDEAVAHIPAKTAVITDDKLVATGEMKPMDLPDPTPLKGRTLDNGYTDLIRGKDGKALFYLEGGGERIESLYGPRWQVSVVYEPANQNYTCFEPMAAITNGVNLAHEGKYPQLQTLAPGAAWRESFWVRTSGI